MTRTVALRSLVAAACGLLAVAGCGGSSHGPSASPTSPAVSASPPPSRPSSSPSRAGAAEARQLEHALLSRKRSPRPTTASCRNATAAEIAHGPFGHSSNAQFTCRLTFSGAMASYDVQLLHTGCYVAERHRPGQAIYGCEAAGSG